MVKPKASMSASVPASSSSSNKGKGKMTAQEELVAGSSSGEGSDEELMDDDGSDEDEDEEGDEDEGSDASDYEAMLLDGKQQQKKPKKVKHPTLKPVAADDFAASLQHLLSLPTTSRGSSTSGLISKPRAQHAQQQGAITVGGRTSKTAPVSANAEKLERRARALVRERRRTHYARGHKPDTIADWGPRPRLPFSEWGSAHARAFARAQARHIADVNGLDDSAEDEGAQEREKRLRRLAQRGVIKLFNAIGAAQGVPLKHEKALSSRASASRAGSTAAASGGASQAGDDAESTAAGSSARMSDVSKSTLKRGNVLGSKGKSEASASLNFSSLHSSSSCTDWGGCRVSRRTVSSLSRESFLDLIRAGGAK